MITGNWFKFFCPLCAFCGDCEKQAKERYYRREIKRVMSEAELAGLLVSNGSVRDPRGLSNLFRVPLGLPN